MSLKVLQAGAFVTLQDLGRRGFLNVGVPPSGAMDSVSHRLANLLLGNDENTPTLEIAYIGPELCVETPLVRLCVIGAGSKIEVLTPEPCLIPEGHTLTLHQGARFRVKIEGGSSLAYLAVAGGFDVPKIMGSTATYLRGGFGGFHGRAIATGDCLPLIQSKADTDLEHISEKEPRLSDKNLLKNNKLEHLGESAKTGNTPEYAYKALPNRYPDDPATIRVVMGPQNTHFTPKGLQTFLTQTFEFSRTSDRMGVRLDGPTLEVTNFEGFISDGITQGAIQVPGGGQPIILMADHQTSGGYPKIATVISADFSSLARMKPGHSIKFEAISVAEARHLRLTLEQSIRKAVQTIRPIRIGPEFDIEALSSGNYVSGFMNAMALTED